MYYIISNPVSGRKKSNYNKIKELYKYLDDNNILYKLFESKYYAHPTEIAKEITNSAESGNIIVIGGDGTLSEVVNGIKDLSKWNIGLVPSGSGNDFAFALGLQGKTLLECLQLILNNNVKKIDYIKVNDRVCVNVLGTGIDVDVLLNFERHTKMKGKFRYFYSLVEALTHVKFREFDVSIDGGEFVRKEGFLITLCNGCHIGGGIPICPGANTNDGQLEFVFVNKVKKIKILGYLIKLMKGKIFQIKESEHIYCQKAVFKDANNLIIQIDGNISKDFNEYKCEIVKEGLNMYL